MFKDHPKCEKITEGIYVFRKIIPKEIIDSVRKEADAYNKEEINNVWSVRNWYTNKVTSGLISTFELWKFMSELIYPELVIHPQRSLLITNSDDEGMFVHADSPGKGKCDLLTEIDTWQTCCDLEYGYVAYLGDFTGGNLYYPNINPDGTIKEDLRISKDKLKEPCLEVKVEEGDLVLHGAASPYDHGTRPTESGRRYAFSTFSLLAKDNPGTFYNYKTPEWYEQIGDASEERLAQWNRPFEVNPQFESLIKEKYEIISEQMKKKSAAAGEEAKKLQNLF